MKKIIIQLGILITVFGFSGLSMAQTVAGTCSTVTDKDIISQIQAALSKDPNLTDVYKLITVTSYRFDVTLDGTVNYDSQATGAVTDAQSVKCVKSVVSKIAVSKPGTR